MEAALSPDCVARYVEAGVKKLRKIDPRWAHKVNMNTLNMARTDYCIVGQVFGEGYDSHLELMDIQTYDEEERSGFTIVAPFPEEQGQALKLLTQTWKSVIKRERAQAKNSVRRKLK